MQRLINSTHIKNKNFCSSKYTVNKIKRQTGDRMRPDTCNLKRINTQLYKQFLLINKRKIAS